MVDKSSRPKKRPSLMTSPRPKARPDYGKISEGLSTIESRADFDKALSWNPIARLGFEGYEDDNVTDFQMDEVAEKEILNNAFYAPSRMKQEDLTESLKDVGAPGDLAYTGRPDQIFVDSAVASPAVWSHEMTHRGLDRILQSLNEDPEGVPAAVKRFKDKYGTRAFELLLDGDREEKFVEAFDFLDETVLMDRTMEDTQSDRTPESTREIQKTLKAKPEDRWEYKERKYEPYIKLMEAAQDMLTKSGEPPKSSEYDESMLDKLKIKLGFDEGGLVEDEQMQEVFGLPQEEPQTKAERSKEVLSRRPRMSADVPLSEQVSMEELESGLNNTASALVPFYDSGVNVVNVLEEYLKPQGERDYGYIKEELNKAGESAAVEGAMMVAGGIAGKYGGKAISKLIDKVNEYELDPNAMSAFGVGSIRKKAPEVNRQMANEEYAQRWSSFDEAETPEDWQKQVKKYVSEERDVSPTIRTPELEDSTRQLLENKITREEHLANVDRYKPVNPWDSLPREPSNKATVFSLKPNQRQDGFFILSDEAAQGLGVNVSPLKVGDMFNGRLDIPAYNAHDTWIVAGTSPAVKSASGGSATTYAKAIHYTGKEGKPVKFIASPKKSEAIGKGEDGKTGYATVSGFVKDLDPDAIREQAVKYLDDPDWVQVGFDPRRQGGFYVRAGADKHVPVREAEEVIQIGPLVLAKKPKLDLEYTGYNEGGLAMDDQMQAILGGKLSKSNSNEDRLAELQAFVDKAKAMNKPEQDSFLGSLFGGSEEKTASQKVDEIFNQVKKDKQSKEDVAEDMRTRDRGDRPSLAEQINFGGDYNRDNRDDTTDPIRGVRPTLKKTPAEVREERSKEKGENLLENKPDVWGNLKKAFGFAEGGEVGAIEGDTIGRDPVSGNEVPAGSTPQEVRDDIPAMLSEGEYVVPADVVRFFGVKFFEDLRSEAKMGLQEMNQNGRIGGEPVANNELREEDLAALEQMLATGAAEGGLMDKLEYVAKNDPLVNQRLNQGGVVVGFAEGGMANSLYSDPKEIDAVIDKVMVAVREKPELLEKLSARGIQFTRTSPQTQPQQMDQMNPPPEARTGFAEGGIPTMSEQMITSPTQVPSQFETLGGSYSYAGDPIPVAQPAKPTCPAGQVYDEEKKMCVLVEQGITPVPNNDDDGGPGVQPPEGEGGDGFGSGWMDDVDWSDPEGWLENNIEPTGDLARSAAGIAGSVVSGPLGAAVSFLPAAGDLRNVAKMRAMQQVYEAAGMDEEAGLLASKVEKYIANSPDIVDKLDGLAPGTGGAKAWFKRNGIDPDDPDQDAVLKVLKGDDDGEPEPSKAEPKKYVDDGKDFARQERRERTRRAQTAAAAKKADEGTQEVVEAAKDRGASEAEVKQIESEGAKVKSSLEDQSKGIQRGFAKGGLMTKKKK